MDAVLSAHRARFPIVALYRGIIPVFHDATLHGKGTLCRECGRVDKTPWVHPILKILKDCGEWKGAIYGGIVVCDGCAEKTATTEAANLAASRLAASGIPKEFHGSTWAAFDHRDSKLSQARRYFSEWGALVDPPWPYIFGSVGTGKTRAACTLLLDWMRDRSPHVRFMTAARLVGGLRSAEMDRSPSEDALTLHAAAKYRLFSLDDVGAEKASDYSTGKLLEFLEARREHGRPTILTSNLDLEQLSAHLGNERISSRLAQWCKFIKLDVSDYRVEDAKRMRGKR